LTRKKERVRERERKREREREKQREKESKLVLTYTLVESRRATSFREGVSFWRSTLKFYATLEEDVTLLPSHFPLAPSSVHLIPVAVSFVRSKIISQCLSHVVFSFVEIRASRSQKRFANGALFLSMSINVSILILRSASDKKNFVRIL